MSLLEQLENNQNYPGNNGEVFNLSILKEAFGDLFFGEKLPKDRKVTLWTTWDGYRHFVTIIKTNRMLKRLRKKSKSRYRCD